MWLALAFASAFFAGFGAVLSKAAKDGIDPDAASAVRFTVIFILAWISPIVTGSFRSLTEIGAVDFLYLILSGIAMGGSWLCYFKALSLGDVNRVVPVDKSSVVLSMLLAFTVLHEEVTALRILSMIIISAGTLLMFPKRGEKQKGGYSWLVFALLSALFAALTSTLSKLGAAGVDADLGTAVRATVMLPMAWLIPILSGKISEFKKIKPKAFFITFLSGAATCLSWTVYYRALTDGPAGIVTPIEKLNLLVSVVLSYFIFGERLTKRFALGISLITTGTFILVI